MPNSTCVTLRYVSSTLILEASDSRAWRSLLGTGLQVYTLSVCFALFALYFMLFALYFFPFKAPFCTLNDAYVTPAYYFTNECTKQTFH